MSASPSSRGALRPVSIVLGHPQRLVRAAVERVLREASDMGLSGQVEQQATLLETLRAERPDILLAPLRWLGPPTYTFVRGLRETIPGLKIIALTEDEPAEQQAAAVRAGVRALLGPQAQPEALWTAVRSARQGVRWLDPEVEREIERRRWPAAPNLASLTPRERQVALLAATGEGYSAIATQLGISEHTVKNHMRHVFAKLSINSRVELAVLAASYRG